MDADKDDKVSMEELSAYLQEVFRAVGARQFIQQMTLVHGLLRSKVERGKVPRMRSGSPAPVVGAPQVFLVDLAGSERVKRSGAEGARFGEAVSINSSLLALGNLMDFIFFSASLNTPVPGWAKLSAKLAKP